jgi:hypothetical protein
MGCMGHFYSGRPLGTAGNSWLGVYVDTSVFTKTIH